jgi:Lamin Tail Domain
MGLTADAYRGEWSATLDSDTSSTKWLYQAVAVDPAGWYEARGMARVDGGEVFIRVSWYASNDGSGSILDSVDSAASGSGAWAALSTGPVQAPSTANSARVRLMLRPSGTATAAFDDVAFVASEPPAPEETRPPSPAEASEGSASVPVSPTAVNRGVATPPRPQRTVAPTSATEARPSWPLSLRISEILGDPVEPGHDTAWEWVELVNIGDDPVDTAGWQIGDGTHWDVLPSVEVPQSGYVVIAAKSSAVATVLVLRVGDGEIADGIRNGGDSLRLLAPNGEEVDAISFGDDSSVFEPAPPAPPAGATLGIRAALSEPAAENWAVTDHPTPGEPNVFPHATSAETEVAPTAESDSGSRQTPSARAEGGRSTLTWGTGASILMMVAASFAFALRQLKRKRSRE